MMSSWTCSTCGVVNGSESSECAVCSTKPAADLGQTGGADATVAPEVPRVPVVSAVAASDVSPLGDGRPGQVTSSQLEVAPGGRRTRLVLLAAASAVLLAGAALAGYLLAGGDDDDDGATPRSEVTTTSATTAAATPSSAPPATTAPTTTSTLPPVPAIDAVDLRAVAYDVPCPLGSGPVRADDPTSESVLESVEPTVVGDLTGDGRADALVSVQCIARGGNGSVASVVVMSSEQDGPRQVGAAVAGYRPVAFGTTFVVTDSRYESSDASCCPSGTAYVPYRVTGGGVAPATGRAPSPADDVTTAGLGAYEAGRTYAEVAAASGQTVVAHRQFEEDDSCQYVEFEGAFEGIEGLGDGERLHMVYVDHPEVQTPSGLRLGSTEEQVRSALAADQLRVEDHQYVEGGHYLTFSPKDSPDHALVMETDGFAITLFKAGDANWANAVEGCL